MTEVDYVKQSFGRSLVRGDVIGRFYDIFLDSHSDVRSRFADTDFDIQKKLLSQGVNLAILFASGSPVGENGINRIGKSHSELGLNISEELYGYWKKSFVEAVSEFDPKFSEELKGHWEWVLQKSINHIVAKK